MYTEFIMLLSGRTLEEDQARGPVGKLEAMIASPRTGCWNWSARTSASWRSS